MINKKITLGLLSFILFGTIFYSLHKNRIKTITSSIDESTSIRQMLKKDSFFVKNTSYYISNQNSNSNKDVKKILIIRIFDNGCMTCFAKQVAIANDIVINGYKRATPLWFVTTFNEKDYSYLSQKFSFTQNHFYIPANSKYSAIDSLRSSYYVLIDGSAELQDFNFLDRIDY